jgi:Ca2+-dependent lipid-binding protein
MPGTIIFKPIEANLTHETSHITDMDPYCTITIGSQVGKGEVCENGGKNPHWNDLITLAVTQESKCLVELFDRSVIFPDQSIGRFEMDLKDVESKGKLIKWYTIFYDTKPAGSVLMETSYQPGIHPHHLITGEQVGMGISDLLKQADELTHELQKEAGLSIQMQEESTQTGEDVSNKKDIVIEEEDKPKVETQSEDPFHNPQKELGGLDLTSEPGPHMSGFDKNLAAPPKNLQDMKIAEEGQTKLREEVERRPPII